MTYANAVDNIFNNHHTVYDEYKKRATEIVFDASDRQKSSKYMKKNNETLSKLLRYIVEEIKCWLHLA